MKSYVVTFAQYSVYDVDADSEDEAIDEAYKYFSAEKSRSIADTTYDEVEVEEIDPDEDTDEAE